MQPFVMSLNDIVKHRKCGVIRFACIDQYPVELNRILEMCGLKPKADKLLEINSSQAISTLARWLHREPAYDTELMSREMAEDLAARFIREFGTEKSRFYTNAKWFEPGPPHDWESLSDFVWDGGIVMHDEVSNHMRHVCLWFLAAD